jgi:hypothetical protein
MQILQAKFFMSGYAYKDLVKWVKSNGIKREDILTITQDNGGNYTLFYYGEQE